MPLPLLAIAGIAQAGIGLAKLIGGKIQERKAEKSLNKLEDNAPQYQKNKGIMDYYNTALSRYNVSPTDSAMYKRQSQNINRGVATGISSFQDRRSGQAGISSLLRGRNDAFLNAEVAGEQLKRQDFNQLGNAANMQAADERTAFDINQMQPFERKYNRSALKAGGGAAIFNSGLSDVWGGFNNFTAGGGFGGGGGGNSANNSGGGNGMVGLGTNYLLDRRFNKPRWQ